MDLTLYTAMQDSQIRKAMGIRIRTLRKQNKWTQKELAAMVGLQFPQLNKYECGVNAPPAHVLIRLAEVFQTSTDYLLSGATSEGRPINNLVLLQRFRAIEDLPQDDIATVVNLLDAMIAKRKMEGVLKSFGGAARQEA